MLFSSSIGMNEFTEMLADEAKRKQEFLQTLDMHMGIMASTADAFQEESKATIAMLEDMVLDMRRYHDLFDLSESTYDMTAMARIYEKYGELRELSRTITNEARELRLQANLKLSGKKE